MLLVNIWWVERKSFYNNRIFSVFPNFSCIKFINEIIIIIIVVIIIIIIIIIIYYYYY